MMSPLRTDSSFIEPRFLGLIRGAPTTLPGSEDIVVSFSPHPPNAPFHSLTQTTVKLPCAPRAERDRDRASVDGLDIGGGQTRGGNYTPLDAPVIARARAPHILDNVCLDLDTSPSIPDLLFLFMDGAA